MSVCAGQCYEKNPTQIGQFKNRIIYSYTINVNLTLICIELSKMGLLVNAAGN